MTAHRVWHHFMFDPEPAREVTEEEIDRIFTEWEYAQGELPRPDTEDKEAA